jgi:hypothetical protein
LSEKQSISDIVEKHTMEIMKKFEGQVPLHIKSFSDFSREYMKLLENSFEINCSIENKMLGDMNLNSKSIELLDTYFEMSSKFYTTQIDISTEFFKNYLRLRLSMMESYNNFVKEVAKGLKLSTLSKNESE